MGLDDETGAEVSEAKTAKTATDVDQSSTGLVREPSESSMYVTEDDDDDDEVKKIELGPQCTLKEHIEKDKDDESLRRWKEQLLGSVDVNSVGETLEPDVKILSLAIKSPDRSDIVLPIPENGNPKGLWFTLKEGSRYSLEFTFQLIAQKRCSEPLAHSQSLTHMCCLRTQPHLAYFCRGSYSARSKFVDDDNKCYLEINYTFDIRKDWQSE
ncbi:hypothetical protein GBA52_022118 [Prunus armeniaca]|nr:hypothetical protein GBA52_022118 [Prunus armeniaca]